MDPVAQTFGNPARFCKAWMVPGALCLFLQLGGCASRNAGAPPPPPVPLLAPVPAAPASSLRLPVELDLDFLRDKALKAAPRPLSQGVVQRRIRISDLPFAPEVGVEIRHQSELEALDLKLRGDQLQVVARVSFAAGGSLTGGGLGVGVASCGERAGETRPAVDFTLRGTLAWGPDGVVGFRPLPWEYRWVRPCELTALKVRLEDVLDLPVVRSKVEASVTQLVARLPESVRIRPLAEQAWREVARPRELFPGILLAVRPESLALGPLSGNGRILTTSIVVKARPVLTDSVTTADSSAPLPPLGLAGPGEGAFHLEAQASVPLRAVDSLLTSSLSGRVFDAGGRAVRVARARLYGGGDKAVLGLSLESPLRGEIFLRGTPLWDSATGQVRLSGLEFDLQTESFLAKSADFLLHGTILQALSKAAVFDLRRFLPGLSDLRIPAGDVGETRVAITSIRPVAFSLEGDRLRAWLQADGRATARFGGR